MYDTWVEFYLYISTNLTQIGMLLRQNFASFSNQKVFHHTSKSFYIENGSV